MGAEFVRGRVCKGPSLSGAEFVRGRDVLESLLQCQLYEEERGILFNKLREQLGIQSPSVYTLQVFTDRSKAVLLLWIFYVFVLSCVCYVLCASVCVCFVVTCWERADLLALVCGVFCEFVTFPLVSWVRCGT